MSETVMRYLSSEFFGSSGTFMRESPAWEGRTIRKTEPLATEDEQERQDEYGCSPANGHRIIVNELVWYSGGKGKAWRVQWRAQPESQVIERRAARASSHFRIRISS
jgi:hypothetical protein